MMTNDERKQVIEQRLQAAFKPHLLEVIDDSAKHIGHAGSLSGAGHFTVIIASGAFLNKSQLAAHKEIYTILNDLIPDEIHALSIKIKKAE